MPIRPGTAADLPQIRQLLASNRSYLNAGLEDLPALLNRAITMVGEDERANLWGFLAFQIETRPPTLPLAVPERVSLRAAAIVQTLFSGNRLPRLIEALLSELSTEPRSLQLFALTGYSWLVSALRQTGFREVDQIRFYLRTQHHVPQVVQPAKLRHVTESDLDELAQLDSETFDPLWHMSRGDLLQLCFTSRLQVAEYRERLAGYTATAIYNEPANPFAQSEAQIVRLAVHPSLQGQGLGRQLLMDCIRYAHEHTAYRIQLNTQASNKVSQRLYESFQFRSQGNNIPVMVLHLPGTAAPIAQGNSEDTPAP